MDPSGAGNGPQGEEHDAPISNQSPGKLAISLRDAIAQRLKTYNEALSETTSLYGTHAVQNDQGMNILTSCLLPKCLLFDLSHSVDPTCPSGNHPRKYPVA